MPNLTGTPARGYDPAYGGVPYVPNPISTAGAATAGNLGNLGGLFDLANQTNAFNQAQLTGAYAGAIPNYLQNRAAQSTNIANNLAGVLSPNDLPLYARENAEYGGSTGSPFGPASSAALQRSLNLKSIDLQNLGQNQMNALVSNTPIAQQFNPASQFVTPDQLQQAQWMANLLESAGIPKDMANKALENLLRGVSSGKRQTQPTGGGGFAPTLSPAQEVMDKYKPAGPGFPDRKSTPPNPFAPPPNQSSYDPSTDTSFTTIPGWGGSDWFSLPPDADPNSQFVNPSLGPEEYYQFAPTNIAPTELGAFDPNYNPFAGIGGGG